MKNKKRGLDLSKYEVPVKELRWNYEKKPDSVQKKPHSGRLSEIIGQDKAVKAIEFGLAMGDAQGYNIFAAGPEGVGKLTAVKEVLEEKVKKLSANLTDQCTVYNFDAPDKPLILAFEAGKGIRFKEELNKFLGEIYTKSFSAIQEEVNKNEKEFESKISPLKEEVVEHLKEKDIDFDIDDQYKIEINYDDKENIEEEDAILDAEEMVQKYNATAKKLIQENDEKNTELVNNKIIEVINNGFKHIKSDYSDKKTLQFLENMQKDMLIDPLKVYRFSKIPESINTSILKEEGDYLDREKIQEFGKNLVNKYKANLIVDNSKTKNAPVIIEINPTYANVIGTISKDKLISLNEENDDHLRTEAGSAIKANEGFLVLNANDLITKEDCLHTLDALSRVIKNREIAIENIKSEQKTDLVKAKTKIIMLGDEDAFYLMKEYFLKFESCFKIKAEFSRTIPNDEENINRYLSFFNSFTTKNSLKSLDDSAAASMIEYSARCSGSKDRLTAKFGSLADVIREANIFAKNEPFVTAKHISKALENRIEINSTLEEEVLDAIKKDYIKIDLKGTKIGEINGLEVFLSTGYDFGVPFKIIAEVSLTDAGSNEDIVNVEGEVGYSDESWDKGMLVLYSHLRGKHAKDKPMPLNIRISHAQEEGIWGNSATLASSLAVYSDFTGLPTKQNIAVTGFMNEAGDVLCIGGVNEKIEGFYKICKLMKINDGSVVIPKSNIPDLMLNDEVIKAVKSNNFKIYAISHIDEAKEIMMDKKAITINRAFDKKIEEANQILSRYRR